MVDSGALQEGVPCIPVKLSHFRNGRRVEIEAHSRKFPLLNVSQSLLSAHERFMRLHSDSEIEQTSREDVLSILQVGARFSMHQLKHATKEELKAVLAQFERNRTIWIWRDHSSLASHGIVAMMVGVVYDSIVFKTENEIGQNVQEFVEEGEVHIVGHGSSSLEDQATLIPECLAELEDLTDDVTSSSGSKVLTLCVFSRGTNLQHNLKLGCLVVETIHAWVVPAIVTALQTSLMRLIVHRSPSGVFRKLLLQDILERYQGASSSTKN